MLLLDRPDCTALTTSKISEEISKRHFLNIRRNYIFTLKLFSATVNAAVRCPDTEDRAIEKNIESEKRPVSFRYIWLNSPFC